MQEMVRMEESVSFEKRKSLNYKTDPADCPRILLSGCKYLSKTAILVFTALLASTVLGHVDSLRFVSIQMPALVQRGANFWLSCQFELQQAATADEQTKQTQTDAAGREQLYSVKWYKNNEEFYRIIFAPSAPVNRQTPQQPTAGQQQYFTQPGVNVLMSSSNATHVRLLNVSLESEGSFACEISTQNLSTIRFEKEIKVYVLPSAKLNLIGLRGLYALGDQVELNCLSDFSRPAGALGWFVNGRRVITSSEANARFRLEPQLTRRKANELKLTRSSLMLKFKLTNELLASMAQTLPFPIQSQSLDLFQRHAAIGNNFNGHHQQDGDSPTPPNAAPTTSNRRNQSKLQPPNTGPTDDNMDQDDGGDDDEQNQRDDANSRRKLLATVSGLRLAELLRLECRYKLTEISDVTFSELKVGAATVPERPVTTSGVDGNNSNGRRRQWSRRNADAGLGRRRRPNSQMAQQQQASESLDNLEHCHRLKLFKSLTNQVHQSSCLALTGRNELLDLLRGTWQTQSVACRAGLLALQREDPVILRPDEDEALEEEREQDDWNGPDKGDRVELAAGSTIGVNCSTLGALFSGPAHQRPAAGGVGGSGLSGQKPMTMRLEDEVDQRSSTGVEGANDQSVIYCSDTEARTRLLISGKYQTANELQWAHSNQRHKAALSNRNQKQQNQKRHHIAYVAFEREDRQQQHKLAANLNTSNINNGRHRHHQLNSMQLVPSDKLNLTPALNLNGADRAAESSEFTLWSGRAKSLDQLHDNLAEVDSEPNNMQQSAWLAPPLLEWFINNQEAPESSVKYSPGLPLVFSGAQKRRQTAAAATEEDLVASSLDQQSLALPSIDYREYFANFVPRSHDQHLTLKLKLDKKHFMMPNSLLRLRCTSTQAQVLAMDSLDVSLYAIPPGTGPASDQNGKQNVEISPTRQTGPSSSWIHRPPSIKSKYIHHKLPAAGQRGSGVGQSATQSPSLQQSNGGDRYGQLSTKFQLLAAAFTAVVSLQLCRQ